MRNIIKDSMKFGFGAALGAGLSTMIFIAIGLAFFIPGIYLLAEERKKTDQSQAKLVLAYILMALGAIIGLGMGASFIFSNLMEDFS